MTAGEAYFTPAHTVHAIGPGIVLCEIQQNSDVTYRLWDYGRPRELHVETGGGDRGSGDHAGAVRPVVLGEGREELVRSRHFVTELVRLAPGQELRPDARTCQLWICLGGQASVGGEPCGAAEVWLLPEKVRAGDPGGTGGHVPADLGTGLRRARGREKGFVGVVAPRIVLSGKTAGWHKKFRPNRSRTGTQGMNAYFGGWIFRALGNRDQFSDGMASTRSTMSISMGALRGSSLRP